MPQQLTKLQRGELDVIQVFEPYVQQALDAGIGKIVYAAADRGWTAYTTFMSTQQKIEQHRDQFQVMGHALQDFSHWLDQSGVEPLVDVVKPFYPNISKSDLLQGLWRYKNAGLWSLRLDVSRAGYNRLLESMLATRTIARAVTYEQVVADFAREN
jgi:NitT/TauT family transport system substrate-binding protein